MRCPFLREAQVKFCCAAEVKKMLVRGHEDEGSEKCCSPEYVNCPSVKNYHEDLPSQDHCPFLQESLTQYCSAASIVKYVPYSDPSLSRCGTSNHRYCELLLEMQSPKLLTPHDVVAPEIDLRDNESNGYWIVDGIQTVAWLYYSPNHMWADIDEDGTCHIGIDAFLARVLGKVDRLTFAPMAADCKPSASLTARGVDFPMIFPDKVNITGMNTYLRADPKRVVEYPYTLGWLFEGKVIDAHESGAIDRGSADLKRNLIHGKRAHSWMQDEIRELTEFAQERSAERQTRGQRLMADGGIFSEDIIRHLTREEILLLYNKFFSPRSAESTGL